MLFNLREIITTGIAIHNFFLCFVCTDQWAPAQQCMEVRKAIIPDWNVSRMKRKLTMTTFWKMTIKSKLLNQFQWSWYSFQKTMLYLMKSDEIKIFYIFEYQRTKIERYALWGTPGIYMQRHPGRAPQSDFCKKGQDIDPIIATHKPCNSHV